MTNKLDPDTYTYAVNLLMSLRDKHIPEADELEPLEDVLGVLTQIDNLTTALTRAEPKVKPLEWGAVDADHENITIRIALSVVGEYRIVSQPKASIHRLFLRGGKVLEFNNYSDAKAAAQSDYESRILSALTTEAKT